MGTAEYLEFRTVTEYSVPLDATDEFLELVHRAADIYGACALSWSMRRSRRSPEYWLELGPRFRERAALMRAADALDRQPDIRAGLERFEQKAPAASAGGGRLDVTAFEISDDDYETIHDFGADTRFGRLPPIDPAHASDAMRQALSLARSLASRLDPVVPEPFSVTAEQEHVVLASATGGATLGTLIDLDLAGAVEQMLEGFQDAITEELTVPWPPDPSGSYAFPEPRAMIRDEALHFWYGPEEHPVLAFEPIPLSDSLDEPA